MTVAEIDITGNIAGGGFIECRSGKVFDLRNPDPALIDGEDIAMSLAMQCRYCGHCKFFYSVAEHCCICHDLVERRFDLFRDCGLDQTEFAFAVLMHDASEAYCIDLPRPVKPLVPAYTVLENSIQAVVRQHFRIKDSTTIHKAIKRADNLVIRAEGHQLMPSKGETWGYGPDIPVMDCIEIQGWSPTQAASEFRNRLCRYTNEC